MRILAALGCALIAVLCIAACCWLAGYRPALPL